MHDVVEYEVDIIIHRLFTDHFQILFCREAHDVGKKDSESSEVMQEPPVLTWDVWLL